MVAQQAEPISSVSKGKIEGAETPAVNQISGSVEDGDFESIGSMAEFKEKAPEVHQLMMQGIGMNICREMQKHQKHLKEIMKKARNER
jgi:hypothetical protein